MAIGPTGAGKSSLLNALLCPSLRFYDSDDCHFKTGSGVKSVTRGITSQQGKWLGVKSFIDGAPDCFVNRRGAEDFFLLLIS